MTSQPTSHNRSQKAGYEKRRALPGLTLVELMIYLAILSLLSVGIMQMILEVQTSNITVLSHADNYAKADLALRRVQVKLGDSDDVEVENLRSAPPDKACLRLKSYEQYERTGLRFDGRHQFLSQINQFSWFVVSGRTPRTISAWVRVDPDQSGTGTVVTWGQASPRTQFGLDIEMVRQSGQTAAVPVLNFNCASMRPASSVNLNDGAWHHVAVTYNSPTTGQATSNTTKMYVDGQEIRLNFVDCAGNPGNGLSTRISRLFVGSDLNDRQRGFKGVISDLRIWTRALTSPEARALAGRDPAADRNIADLYVSMPLDSYTAGNLVNRGSWAQASAAEMFNTESLSPIARTLVDATTYHSFCFLDADSDGLFELWESESSKTLPPLPLGTAAQLNAQGWQSRSDDIFVPGQSGFFKVVGRDPESVIANFAIGKGVLNQTNRQTKTESKALASTRVKKRPELCAITAAPKLATSTCKLSTAFIAIDGYLPGLHGRLDLQYVTWQKVNATEVATDLPNMPTGVTATWYPAAGVMKFISPNPLDTRLWNRIISQTLYRPKGRSSDKTITFNIGVGGLPFFEGSSYHMHEFVEASPPLTFIDASTAATSSGGAMCGMRSYIAAITSEAEQNHLEAVMRTGDPTGWQSGWIGGVIKQGQTFEWASPPQTTAMPFWQGNGATGLPFNATSGQRAAANAATSFEFDQKPAESGHRKRVLVRQEGTAPIRYRYTNWAGGTDFDSCDSRSGVGQSQRAQLCEPRVTADGTAVAIHGHLKRDGTWVSMPGSTAICDATQSQSVCGYYREFDTSGLATGTVLGEKLTVNMDRFREFCEGT